MELIYNNLHFECEELISEKCPKCKQSLFIFEDASLDKYYKVCKSTVDGRYCFMVEISKKKYDKIFLEIQKIRDLQGNRTPYERRVYRISL